MCIRDSSNIYIADMWVIFVKPYLLHRRMMKAFTLATRFCIRLLPGKDWVPKTNEKSRQGGSLALWGTRIHSSIRAMVIHQIAKILFTLRLALELQENKGKPNAKNLEKPETDGVVPPLGEGVKCNYWNNCVADNIAPWRCTPGFRLGDHFKAIKAIKANS